MKTATTLKTLAREGFSMMVDECGRHVGSFGSWKVMFINQDGEVHCLRCFRKTDQDNPLEDYSAGCWFDRSPAASSTPSKWPTKTQPASIVVRVGCAHETHPCSPH